MELTKVGTNRNEEKRENAECSLDSALRTTMRGRNIDQGAEVTIEAEVCERQFLDRLIISSATAQIIQRPRGTKPSSRQERLPVVLYFRPIRGTLTSTRSF